MNKETNQMFSRAKPEKNETTLAFFIKCPKCNTARGFRINDSWALIISRQSSGMAWDTCCEQCGHRIEIQFGWTESNPGWTKKPLLLRDFLTVKDDMGLK